MLRSELGLTWNEVVHEISWQNLMMLSHCVPSYFRDDDNKETKSSSTKASNTTKKVLAKGGGADLMASALGRMGLAYKMK